MIVSMNHLPDQTGRPLRGSLQHQMWPAWALSLHHSCNVYVRLAAGRRAWQKSCTLLGGTANTAARPTCSSVTSDTLIQRATKQPLARSSWQHLPGSPRGYRCRLCLEVDFATRGHLAEHLVGRRHGHAELHVACPYCGETCLDKGRLREHVRRSCTELERDCIPSDQIRRMRQEDFDRDPSYAPLYQTQLDVGRLVVRPMHRSHAFEAALLLTEAFLVDRNPPAFPWMLQDLLRVCQQYERDPSPVTRHDPALDAQDEQLLPLLELHAASAHREAAELYRIQTEDAWGRWLWLVAELVPTDPGMAPAGQDSRVVGAIALMFHDRRVALAKMRALHPPLSAASLDYSLWLARTPPDGLEVTRAAFLWWTAVHYKLRRRGVAQALVRACEGVAAAAGFVDVYIQAATILRDGSSPLGGWLSQEYKAAKSAYERAGYSKYTPPPARMAPWNIDIDNSADLMYKQMY